MKTLNEKQIKAIGFILNGLTDRETAEKVGVSRETVNTWRNKDYNFKAELNRQRNIITAALQDKQREILIKAYTVLEKSLDEQLNSKEIDIKTTLDIVKIFKIDHTVLEDDPEILKHRDEQDDIFKKMLF